MVMRTKAHFQQNHIFIKTIMKWHKVFKFGWLWMICSMLEQIWNKTKMMKTTPGSQFQEDFLPIGSGDDMQYWETFQRSVQDLLIQILNRKQSTCMYIKYHFWYRVWSTFENTAKMSKTFKFKTPPRDSNLAWKKTLLISTFWNYKHIILQEKTKYFAPSQASWFFLWLLVIFMWFFLIFLWFLLTFL